MVINYIVIILIEKRLFWVGLARNLKRIRFVLCTYRLLLYYHGSLIQNKNKKFKNDIIIINAIILPFTRAT